MTSLRSDNKPILTERNENATSASNSPKMESSRTFAKEGKATGETPIFEEKENVNPSSVRKPPETNSQGTKRKAEDEAPTVEGKGTDQNRSSAKHPEIEIWEDAENAENERERTPGRDGPVKEENFDLKPDIKPFKGEKGHKVRKTAREKEEEYVKFVLENEEHPFHEKGPNGSPTFDKSGFQLDYDKVANWMRPQAYNKARIMKGMGRAIEEGEKESRRMAELFFEKGEAPTEFRDICNGSNYWRDRVSKDLNVPWHKVGVKEFEKWDRRGFRKARKGEYKEHSAADKKRMLRLMSGASLRK
ncbi:uncharacterized protein RSE6_06101 [Rhynchosporium secalis]|uniref:Uncharacterized protein n=1 Tax=Rhynchosporium secalis TaxID=38038 RepID=A0A1E1M9I6_RHYSE|nr:uncharacterized protein RSE6_06101 [Rhynchosporium secalis]